MYDLKFKEEQNKYLEEIKKKTKNVLNVFSKSNNVIK